jgi:large repetitive protein
MLAALAGCGGGSSNNHNNGGGTQPPTVTPTFSPAAGTYISAQSVTISDSTSGATIYYTADGSTPTTSSANYNGPITVSSSETIHAIATASGFTTSVVESAAYMIVTPLSITTTASQIPGGTVNTPYAGVTLAATGGVAPYTWSISSGGLPAGLSLNSSTGTISGTPTTAGLSSFTIQVADSELSPQKATLPASIASSSGTLAITTTSLPAGTDGAAYSQTLATSGGVPPLTWSVGTSPALPAGLSLASSTGAISGTPTGVSATSPQFTVTDAAKNTASASLQFVVNPAPGFMPTGPYNFLFSGTSPKGSVAVAGTFSLSGSGSPYTVTGGEFDENTNSNTTSAASATPTIITGGTLTNGTDGLGTLVLTTASGSITFALATPSSIATSGSESAVRIIEFDDTTGTGTRGSGMMKAAQPNPILPPAGSYAFLVSGTGKGNAGNQPQQALSGSFQTDANGNIVGGAADAFEGGTGIDEQYTNLHTNSPMSVDSHGRGTLGIVLQAAGASNYVFYQVSPGEWFTITLDPPSAGDLAAGVVLAQTGAGSFTTASFQLLSTFHVSGLTQPDLAPDVTAGLVFSDGNGDLTFNFDEYKGGLTNGVNLNTPYTVDRTTGRVVTTIPNEPEPILYLIDSKRAFILGAMIGSNTSSSSGILEAQTGSSLTNASLSGSYLGGSLSLDNTGVLNEDGIITADGNGNITFTTNRSTSGGLVQYQSVTGTYRAVGSNGRIEVTLPDGLTRIIYIVSPTKIIYLTSDTGGYVGVFKQ